MADDQKEGKAHPKQRGTKEKKVPYVPPELKRLGTVEELTKGEGVGTVDGLSGS